MTARGRGALLAACLGALTAGCYQPTIASCALACAADQACPDGLTCVAGRCASADDDAVTCADAAPDQAVTIEVLDDQDAPITNATVVFADAGGAVLEEITTGADGRARAMLPADGSVTVAHLAMLKSGQILAASTFLDVPAGAHVIAQFVPSARTRAVDVSWAVPAPYDTFEITASCTEDTTTFIGGTSGTLQVPIRCSTYDLVVLATSASVKSSTPVLAATRASLTTDIVALVANDFLPVASFPATLTDLPPNMVLLEAQASAWHSAERPISGPIAAVALLPEANLSWSWLTPDDIGLTARLVVSAGDVMTSRSSASQIVTEQLEKGAPSYAGTLSGALLPWLESPVIDLETNSIVAMEVLPENVALQAPQIVVGSMQFTRGADVIEWRLVGHADRLTAAGGARRLTFPTLAGDYPFEPLPADAPSIGELRLIGLPPELTAQVLGAGDVTRSRLLELTPRYTVSVAGTKPST